MPAIATTRRARIRSSVTVRIARKCAPGRRRLHGSTISPDLIMLGPWESTLPRRAPGNAWMLCRDRTEPIHIAAAVARTCRTHSMSVAGAITSWCSTVATPRAAAASSRRGGASVGRNSIGRPLSTFATEIDERVRVHGARPDPRASLRRVDLGSPRRPARVSSSRASRASCSSTPGWRWPAR